MQQLIVDIGHAKRLARTIVSDIALYNREKVEEGIRNDSIFELLAEELAEGREHFCARVASGLAQSNIYDLAVVDVLIKRAGKIESDIW